MSQSLKSMAKIRTDIAEILTQTEDAVTRLVVKTKADYLNSKAEDGQTC